MNKPKTKYKQNIHVDEQAEGKTHRPKSFLTCPKTQKQPETQFVVLSHLSLNIGFAHVPSHSGS